MSDAKNIAAVMQKMAQAVDALAQATAQMAEAIERQNMPKRIVRGEDGRAASVEIVEPERRAG